MPVSNEIEKREEEDPDNIDKVPVQADHFHMHEIVGVENIAVGLDDQEGKQGNTDDHVNGVHTRHAEI